MENNVGEAFRPQLKKLLSKGDTEIIDHMIEFFSWYGEKAFTSLLAAERYRICGPVSSKTRRSASNDMIKKIYNEVLDQAKVKKLKDFDSFMSKRIEALRKKIFTVETQNETGNE